MRMFICSFAVLVGLSGPVPAQTIVDVPDVRETIASQFEAFQAQDPVTAFDFASPTIKRIFQTPENFGAMVRNGYPMVWDPADVTYHDQVERGEAVWQRVQIFDKGGEEHWFAYEMVMIDGTWLINGVFPIDAPDLAV